VEEAHEAIADRAPSPLEAAIGSEALANYERALATLSVEERDGVIARVEFGLGYPEIAAATGKTSPDAARMMVSRALLQLAREMGRA
jgi:RNA polymerase sigma-70 factor (ECF subfamily)